MGSLGRSLLIANPAAKNGRAKVLLPVITRLLDGLADYEVVETDAPAHAREIAAAAEGFECVIAVGGDGTVHEVVNGLMDRPADARPTFGVIPIGSGNDYARTLGMSFDAHTAVSQLVTGERKRVDLGLCNGTWFANSIAIGLDARVTAKAVDTKARTGWSGLPLYFRALLYVLFRQYHSETITLEDDGTPERELGVLALAITNGPTYGGGFKITPDSVCDDGLFDVCRIDPMSLPGALMRLPFVIFGKHTGMRVVHMSHATHVRVSSKRPVAGQIDGEVLLEPFYEVTMHPGIFDVIVPSESDRS